MSDVVSEEKFRKATMDLLGSEKIRDITFRKICKKVGAGGNKVHQQFTSLEDWIIITLRIEYFEEISRIYKIIDKEEPPIEKLIGSFDKMMELFWRHPKIIEILYFESIEKSPLVSSSLFLDLIMAQKDLGIRNKKLLEDITGIQDDKILDIIIFQIRGAIMYPVLSNNQLKGYQDPVKRKEYVKSLINNIVR